MFLRLLKYCSCSQEYNTLYTPLKMFDSSRLRFKFKTVKHLKYNAFEHFRCLWVVHSSTKKGFILSLWLEICVSELFLPHLTTSQINLVTLWRGPTPKLGTDGRTDKRLQCFWSISINCNIIMTNQSQLMCFCKTCISFWYFTFCWSKLYTFTNMHDFYWAGLICTFTLEKTTERWPERE